MNQRYSRGLEGPLSSWFRSPHRLALLVVVILTLGRVVYLNLDLFPLFGDEAQYWSWSLEPAFGYYSKPPMVAWCIAATTALAGAGEPAVKLASPLAHAMTALMIYLIGSHLAGRRAGMWSCLVYITMPAVSYSSAIISTDPLLLMFWSVALYGFTRATEPTDRYDVRLTNQGAHGGSLPHPARAGESRWWLLTGFGLGLALLSKYTAVAFAISAFLYIATTSGRRALLRSPGPYLAVATALLICTPNIMWNAEHDFVSLVHVGDNAHWTGDLFNPGRLAEFVLAQFGIFGPLPFACLVAMIVRWKGLGHNHAVNLLLWFAAPLLVAICIQALVSRAYANWAAPIYVAASVAVAIRLLDLGKERLRADPLAVVAHQQGIGRLERRQGPGQEIALELGLDSYARNAMDQCLVQISTSYWVVTPCHRGLERLDRSGDESAEQSQACCNSDRKHGGVDNVDNGFDQPLHEVLHASIVNAELTSRYWGCP